VDRGPPFLRAGEIRQEALIHLKPRRDDLS
jgi:hypothetical protein